MSLARACIIGVIIGCTLYAAFVLTYKKVDAESIQHLREDVRATIDSKLDMLHLHPTPSVPVSTGQVEAARTSPTATQFPMITVTENKDASMSSQAHSHSEGFNAPPSLSEVFNNFVKPAATTASPTTLRVRTTEEATCRTYLEKYAVIPGVSWGTLPSELQKSWKLLKCDDLVRSDIDTVVQAVEEQQQQQSAAAPVLPEQTSKKDKKKGKKPPKPAGIVDAGKDNKAWCHEVKAKYNVVPMRSWGQLPMNYVETWRGRRCDLIFTTERMGARPLSSCPDTSGGGKGSVHSNLRDDLPLIAVMAATTTRKITKPSTQNLSLFMYLLPSLVRTLDCGFRYEYVMGYDKGDPFYDSKEGIAEVQKWFKEHVEDPMRKNGIRVTLRLVKVNNTIKKPGPVFLEMARAAYKAGASYFYRINDDTELMVNWARKYVDGLSTLTEPYGVVGPLCNQGNEKILTHDFTHRLHMEIFEMNYYPPELTDWWMDDWISLVYGKQRTFKARGVPVMHHTGTHGTRYAVDSANGARLTSLVETGRKKIRQYMLTHNVPEHVLKDFDNDQYQSFTHLDLPSRSA